MVEKKEEIDVKKQVEKESRQLKVFFIGMGIIIAIILIGAFIIYNTRHFEFDGVTFNVVKEQNLIFYQTSFPVKYQGESTTYNFYIRNDPRKLEREIPFEGDLLFRDNMVINISGSDDGFNCNGDGIIGVANLLKPLEILEINVVKDPNATCDDKARYMLLQIQPGNETKIERTGPACYTMHVNNCEILKATERFIVEIFGKVNKQWI